MGTPLYDPDQDGTQQGHLDECKEILHESASLQLHPQPVRDSIDEREVGRDRANVVDGAVVEVVGTELIDVFLRHCARGQRELQRVVEHRAIDRIELRPPVVLAERRDQRIDVTVCLLEKSTESRPVMVQSVMALVGGRHDDGDHLALDSRQRPATVHELAIEIVVPPDRRRVDTVDPYDVVVVGDAVDLRDFIGAQVLDVGHLQLASVGWEAGILA